MTKIYGAPFKTVCLAIVASNKHTFKGTGVPMDQISRKKSLST